jgi:hypothetical protein
MAVESAKGELVTLRRYAQWPARLVVAVLLGWCAVSSYTGFQTAIGRETDPIGGLEAEFRWFAPFLPSYALVGYLEPYDGSGGSLEAVRMHYAAQYALSPRVVVARVGAEYLIVARGTARPGGDPRLMPFSRVTSFPTGHTLYRRTP